MLAEISNYIFENKEWIFSGIGVFLMTMLITLFRRRKSDGRIVKQVQKSGDSSVSVQIGNIEK